MSAAVDESGFVHPAYMWQPPAAYTLRPKVETICGLLGETVEPEQALALDVLTGRKPDGSPASRTGVVICARQNLKTFDLERIVLTIALNPHDSSELIMWTSQQLDTTEETFEHFVSWFTAEDEYPFLADRLVRVTRGRGSYQIKIRVGDLDGDGPARTKRIKFKARTGKSGRGLTGDVIVFDEAFAVERAHLGALIPTLSTRRRAMVFYGSSAGHEYSEVLAGLVERGRKGGPNAPAYIEWCAPGSLKKPGCESKDCRHTLDMAGCSLDRPEFWQAANPMLGRRIEWQTIVDERGDLPAAEFARERLGWHDPVVILETPPVTLGMWQAATDAESEIPADAPVVFAAEISLDRMSASIAVAGRRADGASHVGVIGADYGTEWVVPRLVELRDSHKLGTIMRGEKNKKRCDAIVLDPSSPSVTLVDPLRKAGIEPVLMTAREVASACGDLQDALKDGTVWHRASPLVDDAIKGAVKRDLGDGGWAFGRKKSAQGSVDITPIVAITNARWGLTVAKRSHDLLATVL